MSWSETWVKNFLFVISVKNSFASLQELSAHFANGNYVTGWDTWLLSGLIWLLNGMFTYLYVFPWILVYTSKYLFFKIYCACLLELFKPLIQCSAGISTYK